MKRMACAVALAAGSGLAGLSAMPSIAEPRAAIAAAGLQINVVPPGPVSGDASIPLDVKFHGGNIRVIELFVDGARLTRQALSTRDGRGNVHFSLDPTLLSEGIHEVLIKAYEADGTCATATTQLVIASADSNSLAQFEWPKRNAEVQTVVPIKVKIDPSIAEPYVTYTVDNDFLALRNYAPYVYNWDTSKVANGPHIIGIEVMDGKTLQVVQKMSIPIIVKNSGGFTTLQHPSASNAHQDGPIAEAIKGAAESVLPDPTLSPHDFVSGLARASAGAAQSHARLNAMTPGLRSSTVPRNGRAATYGPHGSPAKGSPIDTRAPFSPIGAPDSRMPISNPGGIHLAPGLEALTTNPADLMPVQAKATFGLARQAVSLRRLSGIALRPGTERRIARGTTASSPRPALRIRGRKTFDVAFNNTIINFDVPPRVENGLPLAPFRAIFEHNGGTVTWFNDAKVVRAFDNAREIEIKIGNKEAKVNNVPVAMEAVPYIDHGRTIVPLSFVRDAMDLKVTFDQASGHLMIEKK